ncbi:cyclin-domain-containing protein, partial [Chytridium lagenaria]
ALYHQAPMDLLTLLVSDLLTRLTSHNDTIPLHPTQITRFHSRRPASISITAYLQRIITHAHLTPFHLLSLLIYTDRIAKTLTLSSLTVHRFLCTAVAITSKTHFDVFYSNKVYAEIGGLPIVELNALEMELCFMLNWDLLADEGKMQRYYTSMVKRHPNLVLGA